MAFIIGYLLGIQSGKDGMEELKEAWDTISSSQELKDLVSGGMATLSDLVAQGRERLAEGLAPQAHSPVRRVA